LRAAAAEEAAKGVLAGMGLLAGLCGLVALFPGMLLLLLNPVIAKLVPGADEMPLSYAPFFLAVMVLVLAGGAYGFLRRFGARGEREGAAWNGGFGKAPAWLPFGDPVLQVSATGLSEPVRRVLGPAILGRRDVDPGEAYVLEPLRRLNIAATRAAERVRRATIRQRLAFVFAALVLFLAALGFVQGA
jgi:hypothetical protein